MPTLDWLNRDAAFRVADGVPKEVETDQVGRVWAKRGPGRARFAMLFKRDRGMNLAHQIDAALA